MKISPIGQNSFKATTSTSENRSSYNALLMLQDPKSAVIFEKNKNDAQKANSNDPITALGYKLYRTFRYITNASYATEASEAKSNEKFVTVA